MSKEAKMIKISKLIKRGEKTIGLPPGSLVFVGEQKVERTKISYFDYDESQFQEKEIGLVEECFPFRDTPTVTWINIDGIHEVSDIEKIGMHFDIHPLVLEGIVNTQQRPKLEDYGNCIFVIVKMLYYDIESKEIKIEQVSIVVGENFVISFQEREGDIFEPIRDRIRKARGRIRKSGTDYLAYTLLDAIVDNYYTVLEKVGERLEELEEKVVSDPKPETLHEIHILKREMIFLRKSVWPLREIINGLERGESSLIKESTQIFFRDVYDHTIQVIDTLETYRDMLLGMHDTYLSSVSNRMNEIMKVLTIIATIFIPLTFIAGVYGMNFKFMPELEWRWAYFVVLAVIFAVAVAMLIFFKRKKWL